jgi:hypothetical protein
VVGRDKKVVEAPIGSEVVIIPAGSTAPEATGTREVRIVDDPSAPPVVMHEEDILSGYPYDYKTLTREIRQRYSDFIENQDYHKIRKPLESQRQYCYARLFHPGNPRSGVKRFYSAKMLEEFDKYYTIKRKE